MEDEDLSNYKEVELSGIFIKHDFDHIILNENEVEKYTKGNLTYSTLKQTLFVPFEYDIQVMLYFLHCHFPQVETQMGQDEVQATLNGKNQKYDLLITVEGISMKYYYNAQKIKMEWVTSPKNDMVADSICMLVM